jgi:outer membrane protein TolC
MNAERLPISVLTALGFVAVDVGVLSAEAPAPESENPPREAAPSGRGPDDDLEIGGGNPLMLREVLESVEQHHPKITAAEAKLEASRGEHFAARGGFDPTLRVLGEINPAGYYDYRRIDARASQPTPWLGTELYAGYRIQSGRLPGYEGQYETLDGGEVYAGVRLPLWQDRDLDKRRAARAKTERKVEESSWRLAAERLEVQLAAAESYYKWVASGYGYDVKRRLVGLARDRARQIERRIETGAAPEIELVDNRQMLLKRERGLADARQKLAQAAYKLALYLRSSAGSPLVPSPRAIPGQLPGPNGEAADAERAVARALDNRPDVAAFQAMLEQVRIDLDLAEARLGPRLDVTLHASRDVGTGTETQITQLADTRVGAGVLLELPIPLRSDRGQLDAAQGELRSTEAKGTWMRDQIAADVRSAHAAVEASAQRYELARERAELSETIAAAERRRYELGSSTLLVVNLREQAAADAAIEAIESERALRAALARYRVAQGLPVRPD